ncbi:glycosyltransferase family 2 protein [Geomonas sp. Red32]|uniref:glycosyltransferase family 2 protein n=1 Tax=Geomonas sp. Red32 TaxID=2912856 RepID=UPI00202D084F|nr:glycosyltransferase family A protein [Geomonas sp. Red32]MCM0082862.1 glycosyltransferase family 2 protein [Geomonas sp. Red32]
MEREQSPRYVVVTPVKDEASYIVETLESVCRQTLKPARWVVVDDGSRDETATLVRRYAARHDWIELVQMKKNATRFPGPPVVTAFNCGAQRLASLDYDFIVKLDGDLRLSADYFERLAGRFLDDPTLGIASGVYLEREGGGWSVIRMPAYHAAGASKMVRRCCFEEIGGFSPTLGWDTLDEIKAQARGWKTAHFDDLPFQHLKSEGSGIGKLKTSMLHGRIFYLTGGRADLFLVKALKRMLVGRPPILHGVLMMWGYLTAAGTGKRLVTREEAARYNALLASRLKRGAFWG